MKKREKHGMSQSQEYKIWSNAKKRCTNPNCVQFKHYGARGISMHPDWMESFLAFYRYVGHRPDGYELDRIDNDKGYHPGNVRWSTKAVNVQNRRNTVRLKYKGRMVLVNEFANAEGISYGTAWDRARNRPHRIDGPELRIRGEKHHKAKITDSQADEIRTSSEQTKCLAQKFGVSCSLIRQIRRGKVRVKLAAELGVQYSENPRGR